MPLPEKMSASGYRLSNRSNQVKSYDNGDNKRNIGVTAGEFKDRYRIHKKSFKIQKYANEMEPSCRNIFGD
jgi:hypothetical protein